MQEKIVDAASFVLSHFIFETNNYLSLFQKSTLLLSSDLLEQEMNPLSPTFSPADDNAEFDKFTVDSDLLQSFIDFLNKNKVYVQPPKKRNW